MAAIRFDAFRKIDDFTGISHEFVRSYYPISSLENTNQFEYAIPPSSRNFMDLTKSRLTLDICITKADGSSLDATSLCAPVANAGNSLFRSLDVLLNSTNLNAGENVHYAYRSYIHQLLTKDSVFAQSWGRCEAFLPDSPHSHKDNNVISSSNAGLRDRYYKAVKHTHGKYQVSIYLTSDVFQMEQFLCPGVGIHLKFTLHRPEFYIITSQTEQYTYKVTNAVLYMTYLSVSDSIYTAYENAIAKEPALFKYPRTDTKSFVLSQGSSTASLDQIITHGPFDTMIIALINNRDYSGQYDSTPLCFQHYNLDFCSLSWEGTLISGQAFSPKFVKDDSKTYEAMNVDEEKPEEPPEEPPVPPVATAKEVEKFADIYSQLFNVSGNKNCGSFITPSMFTGGYFLIRYDIPPQKKQPSPAGSGLQGLARISLKFAEPLPEAVTCLLITTTNSYLAIDKDRNVILFPEVMYPKKFK